MTYILPFILSFALALQDDVVLEGPFKLIHDDEIIEIIEPNDLSLYGFDYIFVDMEKVNGLLNEIGKQVYEGPIDAYIDDTGHIVNEVPGKVLNERQLLEKLLTYHVSKQSITDSVPIRHVYPRVTAEILSRMNEQPTGHYVTYYNADKKERSHNIQLAAKAIDHTILFPNETFSFNAVVGERTEKRGYLQAPVIVEGEFTEDIGGGICQVSSTLYNAVDIEGIQIIERYSHSREVPYVPPGRDAAVSWWGPDFSFKNLLNEPILIRASAQYGVLDISLYTSDEDA